jgi:hypothetical protein
VASIFIAVFVLCFFACRSRKLWTLWRTNYEADVVRQNGLSFLLSQPTLIRNTEREDDVASTMYASITNSLWGGCARLCPEPCEPCVREPGVVC